MLYEQVGEYAALGNHHRTGTPADEATRSWFAKRLAALGAQVEEAPYAFERYDAHARLTTADGIEISALPLEYSGTGRVEVEDVLMLRVPFAGGMPLADLDELVASSGSDALVVVTDGPGGRLVAPNREPTVRPGPLAVLVAGSLRPILERGPCRLAVEAKLVPVESATVVGSFGGDAPDPVVVTTPLTGWFRCAGERGTGIAEALQVAARLAVRHPVLVVGTTGHELEYLGARVYLAANPVTPRAVVHLGAGIAAGDADAEGTPHLGTARFAMTTAPEPARFLAALAPAGFSIGFGTPWPGEGDLWRDRGGPVLSLIGIFERFHTPDDVPAEVTSPELLAQVCDAVCTAADLLTG